MQGQWSKPVILEIRIGRYRTIMSTAEAISCLLDPWLFDDGEVYNCAVNMCFLAREGKISHERARVAFVAAVDDAAIYVVPECLARLHIAAAQRTGAGRRRQPLDVN
jgi:hypothetical protein